MKSFKLILATFVALLLCSSFISCHHDIETAVAANADSVAFMSAARHELKVRAAKESYIISARIFNSPQTISVIRFSPKHFAVLPIMSPTATEVSKTATLHDADIAINACYWNIEQDRAITLIKIDGEVLSTTLSSMLPRVNGLLYIYDDYIEINQSEAIPDYPGLIEECDNVMACGPVLMDDGHKVSYKHITETDHPAASFYLTRHPRTVIGHTAEGDVYFIVVDGRSAGNADGMSIEELTQLCSWLEMTEAMNLDGGGSSTLWCRERGVINHPCDNKKFDHEGERKVLSAILAKRK
ncbi:MAG: phosphodiester glycosidase family protein [Alistipes sp.]|nr:phosphodiester glycosidase family protein [Alistipes sp.]